MIGANLDFLEREKAWEDLKSKYDRNIVVNSLKKMNNKTAESLDPQAVADIQAHANLLFDSGNIVECFKYVKHYLELAVQLNNLCKGETDEL